MRKCAAAVACLGGLLAWPGIANATPLNQIGQLVAPRTGEATGPFAVSGNAAFGGAADATFTAQAQGAVFVFTPAASGWSGAAHESAILTAATPVNGEGLGTSVDAQGTAVVAGTQTAAAYVFLQPPGGWSGAVHESAKLIASNGDRLIHPTLSGTLIVAQGINQSTGADSVYVFVEPASGWSGTLHESARLVASDGYPGDGLGASVAVSGATIVAGAPSAKVRSQPTGAAYVFTEPATGWSGTLRETAKLTGSDVRPQGFAPFAAQVAISGTTIVASLPSTPGAGNGAEYVFEQPAGGWRNATESAKLVASHGMLWAGQSIISGASLAISGTTIAVSGVLTLPLISNPQRVFVFTKPAGGWSGTVTESAQLASSDGGNLSYPTIVGQTIIAGALGVASTQTVLSDGPAYVFEPPPGGWSGTVSQTAELKPTLARGSEALFAEPPGGWANASATATLTPSGDLQPVVFDEVATSGRTAVAAGNGHAFVFAEPGAGWGATPSAAALSDSAGQQLSHVAISGSTVTAIAAGAGRVDVFTQPGAGWAGTVPDTATLIPSDGTSLLGAAVDGTTVVAVSSTHGYVFTEPPGGWTGTAHENARLKLVSGVPYFGSPVSMQGPTVVVGGAISGATALAERSADVFIEPAGGWSGLVSPTATLSVPSWDARGEHVFLEPQGGWVGTIRSPAALLGGSDSVALSGSTVALSGVAYPTSRYDSCPCSATVQLFTQPSGGWSGLLGAPVTEAVQSGDGAPIALALSGDTLFAGGQIFSPYTSETALGVFAITGPIPEYRVTPGRPAARLDVTGLAKGRPRLHLHLSAGSDAPPIRSFTLSLPRGLRLGRHFRRGISGSLGPFTARRRSGRLAVRLTYPADVLTIVLRPAALVETAGLRRRVQQALGHHHRFRLRVIVRATDAAGRMTRISAVLVL